MPRETKRVTQAAALLALVAVAGLVAACRPGSAEIAPPEIRYGEDVCADCNMIVSDPRFAAAYLYEVETGRYASLIFDDIGDMVVHADRNPDHRIAAWYVHDHGTEAWLDATRAHFVRSRSIQSPMAFGVAAFESPDDAERLAAETGGEVLDWEAARAAIREGPIGGM